MKKLYIMLVALMLITFTTATMAAIMDTPLLNVGNDYEPLYQFGVLDRPIESEQKMFPGILDLVNQIINNVYKVKMVGKPTGGVYYPNGWQGWTGGHGQEDYSDRVEKASWDNFPKNLITALRMAKLTDCYNQGIYDNPELECERVDLNGDNKVDVFDLSIIGNEA